MKDLIQKSQLAKIFRWQKTNENNVEIVYFRLSPTAFVKCGGLLLFTHLPNDSLYV